MKETTVPEQKGDTSFWPPWAVFLLGILFAALNWWRMDKKAKAIFFLALSFLLSVFVVWTEFDGGITETDHAIARELILGRFFLALGVAGLLAVIMSIDIKRFKQNGQTSYSVKWQIIFVFSAILIVARFCTWATLDYVARNAGECRFPRLQDVVYQKEFEQRTGLATLVLGRNDFGCEWEWDMERHDWLISNKKYDAHLTAWYDRNKRSYFHVFETVTVLDEATTDEFLDIANQYSKLSGSNFPVTISDPFAVNSYVDCSQSGKFTSCRITLGYQKIVSQFDMTFVGLSDQQMQNLISSMVSVSSTRIHEYEAGLQ